MWCMSDNLYFIRNFTACFITIFSFYAGPKEEKNDLEEGMTTLSLAYAYEH